MGCGIGRAGASRLRGIVWGIYLSNAALGASTGRNMEAGDLSTTRTILKDGVTIKIGAKCKDTWKRKLYLNSAQL